MKNNNNWIWILVILALIFIVPNFTKKEAISPLIGGDYDVYISDYNVEGGYLTATVNVTNRLSTSGSMYVELGVYALEDNPWLQNYVESNKKSFFGDPDPVLENNCVETETNVQTYRFDLEGSGNLNVWEGKELKEYRVKLPSLNSDKTYYILAQAFKQCAYSGGDIGMSDYSLIKLVSVTPGGDDLIITGLTEGDLEGMATSDIAEHTCTDKSSICESSSKCLNLNYLEDKRLITSAQGDEILDEAKPFWQSLVGGDVIYRWMVDIFDDEDKSKVGVCVKNNEGLCITSINQWMSKLKISDNCQINTIIFFVAIFMVFMLIIARR